MLEAEKRGLLNLKTTADALPYFVHEKNVEMFCKHKVFTADEMHARYEIMLEGYCKTLNIEALTMLEMVKKDILPAVSDYCRDMTATALQKKQLLPECSCEVEETLVKRLSKLSACLYQKNDKLEKALLGCKAYIDPQELANYYRDVVLLSMQETRSVADELETLVGSKYWPYPTYCELLFQV